MDTSGRRESLSQAVRNHRTGAEQFWDEAQVEEWVAWYFPYDRLLDDVAAQAEVKLPQAHVKPRRSPPKRGTMRFAPGSSPHALREIGSRLNALRCVCHTTLTPTLDLVVTSVSFDAGLQRKVVRVYDPNDGVAGAASPCRSGSSEDDEETGGQPLALLTPMDCDRNSFVFPDEEHPEEPVPCNGSFVADPQGVATDDEAILLAAVHHLVEFNKQLSHVFKTEVHRVSAFYQRTSCVVSGAAAAAIDTSKVIDTLGKKQQARVEKTFQQAAYSLSMLQQYCDQSYLAAASFLKVVGEITYQRIDSGGILEAMPFYMTQQDSSVALLRQLLVTYYADNVCGGSPAVAETRIRGFIEADTTDVAGRFAFLKQAALGIVAGGSVALGCVCLSLFTGLGFTIKYSRNTEHAAYLFALTGIPIYFAVGFAANVWAWQWYRVNFAYSFGMHPFRHFKAEDIVLCNGVFALIWLGCAFFFLRAEEMEFIVAESSAATAFTGAAPECVTSTCMTTRSVTRRLATAGAKEALVPAWLWPYLVAPISLVWIVVYALWTLAAGGQLWFLRSLGRIAVTPLFPCYFTDFFICEQLVSLAHVLFEFQFFWCVFSDRTDGICHNGRDVWVPALAMLPSIWRCLQSLRRFRDNPTQRTFYPHLLNATKYFISVLRYLTVMTFFVVRRKDAGGDAKHSDAARDAMLVLYFLMYTLDSCVKMGYETWVEYGVLRCGARHFLLRDVLLFPTWTYYVAVPLNTVCRWMWVWEYFFSKEWFKGADWVFPLFAIIEASRRLLWNFYRVEHDQVDNTENYKAVRIAPLEAAPHASSHVDWQVTEEDLERRFSSVLHTDPSLLSVDGGTPTSLASVRQATEPFGDPHLKAHHSVAKASHFFLSLPQDERIEVLRAVLPTDAFAVEQCTGPRPRILFRPLRGTSTRRMPPARLFASLHEEDKVRALLLRIGAHRTAAQYLEEISAESAAPSRANSRLVRRSSSILRAAALHNNARFSPAVGTTLAHAVLPGHAPHPADTTHDHQAMKAFRFPVDGSTPADAPLSAADRPARLSIDRSAQRRRMSASAVLHPTPLPSSADWGGLVGQPAGAASPGTDATHSTVIEAERCDSDAFVAFDCVTPALTSAALQAHTIGHGGELSGSNPTTKAGGTPPDP